VSTHVPLLVLFGGIAALFPIAAPGQNLETWQRGGWSAWSPRPGGGEWFQAVRILGPGAVSDPQSASPATSVRTIPGVRAQVRPETRQSARVIGEIRSPVMVAQRFTGATLAVAGAAQQPAPGMVPTAPSRPARSRPNAAARTAGSASAAQAVAARQARASSVASSPPVLDRRSELRSLSSVRTTEDKCEVLLSWLESSKIGTGRAPMNRYRPNPELLGIFRDEPMVAVFGTRYDETENRWRMQLHEDVMSRCLGQMPTRRSGLRYRPSQALLRYRQAFQQYRTVLGQAFLGQPGPFEPTAISRHVQEVRSQIAWVSQVVSEAETAPPTLESFNRITHERQAAGRRLSLLSPAEKSQTIEYLSHRLSAIAPRIGEEWLREARQTAKGAASAKVLNANYRKIEPVVSAMEPSVQKSFRAEYTELVTSLIGEPVQLEIARLREVPATLAGVLQLSAWQDSFDASFGELRGFPVVAAAAHEFQQARARVAGGALPSWIQQVNAIPVNGAAITAKRREMETLFPSPAERSSNLFDQYETPLRAKEDQLRLRVEQEMLQAQRQTHTANNQGPPESGGAALTEGSFNVKGLNNEAVLNSLYRGDFVQIAFDREDLSFVSMYDQYLFAYGRRCASALPPNKVEITRQRCTEETVTKNGYGMVISSYCSGWATEGTGVYADPRMYEGKIRLAALAAGDTLRNTVGMLVQMTKGDPIAGVARMVGDAIAIKADMEALVQLNSCKSPALRRFEENLKSFALNKPPIRLGEQGPKLSVIDPLPGIPFRDQNYGKLIEDLVGVHSKTWAMNRYARGSVTGVRVGRRDSKGRPSSVSARYTYEGFRGRSQGSVNLTFRDGLPECMYFHDFPSTCRTPDRKLVAAYSDGAYQQ
jgi:hypothetical protein